ncbi:MAG TPA: polysaccharide deacetylase family protein [Pyrinomonadaceae bacterium]|nr:polysaccharide deacetylase family protein [Pyrinomonadaceae bacterium]
MKLTILIALLFCLAASAYGQEVTTRTMAVTIDDLPFVNMGDGPYLANARAATTKILSTLKKYKISAVGFVNEGNLANGDSREARIALLRQWVDAGMILGNHTYSHTSFNRLTIEEFEDDIVKGEVVSRRLMHSREPYQLYFRHPMTHTGDTQEKKEAVEQFLQKRGYKVTPHTIENADFIFNVGYAQALQSGDKALAKRLRDAYLDFTIAATEFAEKISPQVFGREIPQTLLIHSNALNADTLDEMLQRFAARGYRFVSLDNVMADPAYQTKDTFVTKSGPTWLWRWMKSKSMNVDFAADPEPPKWVMDLYKQKVNL